MTPKTFVTLMALAAVGTANATIVESESNDTFGTANLINRTGTGLFSDVGVANLTQGDVDWFKIRLNANEYLTAATTPLDPTFVHPDTYLALFDTNGSDILIANDDGGDDPTGTTYGSEIIYQVPTAGTYFLAVAGYNNTFSEDDVASYGAPVDSDEIGRYGLTVSVIPEAVPEPTSMAALGIGALALLRRRCR